MIFRLYTLCWLTFACADDISRIESTEASDESDAVAFSHYELEEIETEPDDMPAQNEDATLKDVKFISKISATKSLLITEKNVTWIYDEEANVLKKISFDGDKTYLNEGDKWTQMGDIEYGFSQHLVRMYVKDKTRAKLVVVPSMSTPDSFATVHLSPERYDHEKPPRILYLDAETEKRTVPSVLMFTWEKVTREGKETSIGKYVLNSDTMTCGRTHSIPVLLDIGRKFDLSAKNIGAGGIASDGASFWMLTGSKDDEGKVVKKNFELYVFHGCEQKGENNEYNYEGVTFKAGGRLSVSYKGQSASKLPLGIWINVSQKDRPVIEGKIISLSEEGKLLSADVPSAP